MYVLVVSPSLGYYCRRRRRRRLFHTGSRQWQRQAWQPVSSFRNSATYPRITVKAWPRLLLEVYVYDGAQLPTEVQCTCQGFQNLGKSLKLSLDAEWPLGGRHSKSGYPDSWVIGSRGRCLSPPPLPPLILSTMIEAEETAGEPEILEGV